MAEENIAMNETENLDTESVETVVESTPTIDDLVEQFDANEIINHPTLKKEIQRLTDSTVTKALHTAKTKWEKEALENLDEAKKLEKMNEEQRAKYQLEKEKEEFEKQRKAFEYEQLTIATGKELLKRGLDASFAEYLTSDTAEHTAEKIDAFENAFNDAVALALNNKMKGQAPKEKAPVEAITKETIKNMTPAEINANWDAVKKALASK